MKLILSIFLSLLSLNLFAADGGLGTVSGTTTVGTIPAGNLPALGVAYPNALTNNSTVAWTNTDNITALTFSGAGSGQGILQLSNAAATGLTVILGPTNVFANAAYFSNGIAGKLFLTNTIFTAVIDGAGSTIATGPKNGFPVAGDSYTISGWSITAMGNAPTCTIDVWKVAAGTALPNVGNTIMGTKPALSSGNAVESTTLTSWNTTVTKGDIWGINVDACSNATNIVFQIFGYR